jgi:hypothetical protein
MARIPLHKDGDFIVQEEKILVYFLAFLFLALFSYGVIDALLKGFNNVNYQSFIFLFALVPAFYFLSKGLKNRVYIRINKTGIFQYEQLLTDWPHFIDAYITQKKSMISIRDNFVLAIEYYKVGLTDGFRRKIPLTNTQNKSEEEIIEAIKFFYKQYRESVNTDKI